MASASTIPFEPRWSDAQAGAPLPLLLMLEPTMCHAPWAALVERTAAAMHVPPFMRDLTGTAMLATLEQAIAWQRVQGVVICGEGPGTSFVTSSLALRVRAAAAAVRALVTNPARRPFTAAVWHDTERERLRLFAHEPVRHGLVETATHHPLLHALAHPA